MKERIGEYFVGMQMLSLEHIERIVEYQGKHPDLRFGEIAVKFGYLDQKDIEQYVENTRK